MKVGLTIHTMSVECSFIPLMLCGTSYVHSRNTVQTRHIFGGVYVTLEEVDIGVPFRKCFESGCDCMAWTTPAGGAIEWVFQPGLDRLALPCRMKVYDLFKSWQCMLDDNYEQDYALDWTLAVSLSLAPRILLS
jgi:hypothetical protein